MGTYSKFIKIVLLVVLAGFSTRAGLLYNYHQLAVKDLDQMNSLVKEKLKESKQAYSGKVVPLKEGLQAVFSRPNTDGMLEKVIESLKSKLDQEDALEKTYEELIQEAINALKNSKNFKRDVQVTYAIFLENIISEFKPDAKEGSFELRMINKIAESDLDLSKEARKERKLRLMIEGASPSLLAKKVLEEIENKKRQDPQGLTTASEQKKTEDNSSSLDSISPTTSPEKKATTEDLFNH